MGGGVVEGGFIITLPMINDGKVLLRSTCCGCKGHTTRNQSISQSTFQSINDKLTVCTQINQAFINNFF